jgi:lipid A 3-O-deacylase
MKICTALLFFSVLFTSFAQEKTLKREFQVEADNDAYTLSLTRDQYYSNGIFLRYRFLTDSSKWKSSLAKVVRSYDFNHRIFSPKYLAWTRSSQMDRPYAGQMSLSASNEYYYNDASYLKLKLELGWMGPALNTGDLQYAWHNALGMQLPQGWKYQINDAPIINLYGTYAKTLASIKDADVLSESNMALGTSFTHVRQEFVFRMGNLNAIHQSTQLNGVIGRKDDERKLQEFYFFISPGVEYVAYNSTIEGNFIGRASIYTETRQPWIYQTRAGLLWSWTKFDFALLYYRRTKETSKSTFHKYVGIRMNLRF